jgi:hypothetical protein
MALPRKLASPIQHCGNPFIPAHSDRLYASGDPKQMTGKRFQLRGFCLA